MDSSDFFSSVLTVIGVMGIAFVWLVSPFALTMITLLMITENIIMSIVAAIAVEILVIIAGLVIMDVG